jgi:hypothetical protein
LEGTRSAFLAYPAQIEEAVRWCLRETGADREVYHCAHLLTARRRVKDNAAPLFALYVDGDGAKTGDGLPEPTAVVESSPGREQFYWILTEPVAPEVGELLNRRLALAMGADLSGHDLTQLLRPPGTRNFKYPHAPTVRLAEINGVRHDPVELARLLPPGLEDGSRTARCATRPTGAVPSGPADLSRLSARMRDLVRHGNRGEYESRSEADMAACVAMFGSGYTAEEVWAVMTDPTNGISEKFLKKGRHGERYLALTIGKARAHAEASSSSSRRRLSKSKARRVRRHAP